MHVKFWGTRGSLPVSLGGEVLRDKIHRVLEISNGRQFTDSDEISSFIKDELPFSLSHGYGGSSPCVEILPAGRDGSGSEASMEQMIFCDMGSGLRESVQQLIKDNLLSTPREYHFFMSHVHWDHIMGFPFFTPAYIPGNRIVIHGCHDCLESALIRQHSDPNFPVQWAQLGADIEFELMTPGQTVNVAGMTIEALKQHHHGDSYGYRFTADGRSLVYSTDSEHPIEAQDQIDEYIAFIKDADLVIFDAMYSLADMTTIKQDWGHSSNIVGVDLCRRAGVAHYCMFHHEPIYTDESIEKVLQETIRYEQITRDGAPLRVSSAYDGLLLKV